MTSEKFNFHSLAPDLLEKNKEIYDAALDYARNTDSVRNIAITGIYGAGKSTVWNTYCKTKNLSNIISVSLGNFRDDNNLDKTNQSSINIIQNNEESKVIQHEDTDTTLKVESAKKVDNDLYNRVERQIINQITSQIPSDKIPLSKYAFKENKNNKTLIILSMNILFFILSILGWTQKNELISLLINMIGKKFTDIISNMYTILCVSLFICSITYLIYNFIKNSKMKVTKVNLHGTEANFSEDGNDETVLDRDIKELVYLLYYSEAEIVVFEDLDRYDNIDIFSKLRELNFLLNSYIATNSNNRIVKFIYMVKDELFISKNRTKFFDFIIPIVPIIDSKTSDRAFNELFKGYSTKPDSKLLLGISLYVDDMRLIRNIVNEFLVYSNIIPLDEYDLKKDKLFALIVIKNIFPNEFDKLQIDEGYIYGAFAKINESRNKLKNNLIEKISSLRNNIEELENRIENNKFEEMAIKIPVSVNIRESNGKTWCDFLKWWFDNKETSIYVEDSNIGISQYYNYDSFVRKYELDERLRESLIYTIIDNKQVNLDDLHSEINKLENDIKNLSTYSYKKILSLLDEGEINEVFLDTSDMITKNHYFPLIRYLIIDGQLDESYCYYKTYFTMNGSEYLTKNDRIFLKNVLENDKCKIDLELTNFKIIMERLEETDFDKVSILNKSLIQYCIDQHYNKKIIKMFNTALHNFKFNDLGEIFELLNFEYVNGFINLILLENKTSELSTFLDRIKETKLNAVNNILISLYCNQEIDESDLLLFNRFILNNVSFMNNVSESEFENLKYNLIKTNVKFNFSIKEELKDNYLRELVKEHLYELNMHNVLYLAKKLSNDKIEFGCLLNVIYNNDELTEVKAYIEEDFNLFMKEYIDLNVEKNRLSIDENVFIKILESELSCDLKLRYINQTNTKISDLSSLDFSKIDNRILSGLLGLDLILISSENISKCWSNINNNLKSYISYLDRNINLDNYQNILINNNNICNILINNVNISEQLFTFMIEFANIPVNRINIKLSINRIRKMIGKKLIMINDNNINLLLQCACTNEIIRILKSSNIDEENQIIDWLLDEDIEEKFIYDLINSKISNDNSIKLIDKLPGQIDISKVRPNRFTLIRFIINHYLNMKNIEYIINNFKEFKCKEEFIGKLVFSQQLFIIMNFKNNKDIICYALSCDVVDIEWKLKLIILQIKHRVSIKYLSELISQVPEIKEIASIWEHRYPKIDNEYKGVIADMLINNGYAKIRNDKNMKRLMAIINE